MDKPYFEPFLKRWIYKNNFIRPKKAKKILLQVEMVEKAQVMEEVIAKHLDSKAQSFGFDDIKSARTYTGFNNHFKPIAIKLAKWSADVWFKAEQIKQEVAKGKREMPTVEELLNELPKFTK